MRINKSDIEELTIYVWICPECGKTNHDTKDPDYLDYYHCPFCQEDIELQDD